MVSQIAQREQIHLDPSRIVKTERLPIRILHAIIVILPYTIGSNEPGRRSGLIRHSCACAVMFKHPRRMPTSAMHAWIHMSSVRYRGFISKGRPTTLRSSHVTICRPTAYWFHQTIKKQITAYKVDRQCHLAFGNRQVQIYRINFKFAESLLYFHLIAYLLFY